MILTCILLQSKILLDPADIEEEERVTDHVSSGKTQNSKQQNYIRCYSSF